ncbi:BNR Asp-box repeat protein, putative [Babesia ovis]|uniref:BNR Asp-box repeat protein, putative n=1 Tax=Babesia ovis TaxID=5869 RepID=A0A9W5WVY4_BABOV|nr:BNR Asp-box repeat protein, putative [Babesia ovis]
MTNFNTHRVGDIWLQSRELPLRLKTSLGRNDDSIVKIEFDRSISLDIKPQDVLEALSTRDIKDDTVTIVVKGSTLECKFIEPKAITLTIGDTPNGSVDVTDRFLGTIFVSTPKSKLKASFDVSYKLYTYTSTSIA